MRLVQFALLYGAVGLGSALLRLCSAPAERRLGEAAMLLWLWPLLGPVFLARGRPMARVSPPRSAPVSPPGAGTAGGPSPSHPGSLESALLALAASPLGPALPEPELIVALVDRVAGLRRRLLEMDALLASPRFGEQQAAQRQASLQARGHHRAAELLARRLPAIVRLRELRAHCARELDELAELGEQLCVTADLLRLGAALGPADDVWGELAVRVERLEAVLASEIDLGYAWS